MPPEETMDVPYSEPTEEVVAPSTDTPEPEVTPETEPETAAEPSTPEVELFELPDGRKVDAETLSKEWKENFYPDYTRKSQALKAQETVTKEPAPSTDPEWVPQSYEELLTVAEQRVFQKMEQRQREEIESRTRIENEVVTQLETLKKTDPTLNENALFLHANKYGFRDLAVAHQNMKDMNALVKTTQDVTAKNIAKRADPVSVTPGASGGARPDPSGFSSAVEYMRSLK
jgi:hypothetical protein